MFDDKSHTMVHSKGTKGEGPSVVFNSPKALTNVQIQTRHNCCNERYEEMCLYADDNKIACTPKNFKIGKSEWFNFKVIFPEIEEIIGTKFDVKFMSTYAQVAALKIEYKDIK